MIRSILIIVLFAVSPLAQFMGIAHYKDWDAVWSASFGVLIVSAAILYPKQAFGAIGAFLRAANKASGK